MATFPGAKLKSLHGLPRRILRRNRKPRRRPFGSSFSASFEALVLTLVGEGIWDFVDWPRRHPSPVPAPDVQGSQRCGRFDFSHAKCKYAPAPCYRSKQLALGGMHPNHNESLFGFLVSGFGASQSILICFDFQEQTWQRRSNWAQEFDSEPSSNL